MNTPEKHLSGGEFRLSLAVQNELAHVLIANTADSETRGSLPGFLQVYSTYAHVLDLDDMFDGHSRHEDAINAYKRRISDYNRHKFTLHPGVELRDKSIMMRVYLGYEAASRVYSPPFNDAGSGTELEVYYRVPGQGPVDESGIERLERFAATRPKAVFSHLGLVAATGIAPPEIIRSTEATDDILQI